MSGKSTQSVCRPGPQAVGGASAFELALRAQIHPNPLRFSLEWLHATSSLQRVAWSLAVSLAPGLKAPGEMALPSREPEMPENADPRGLSIARARLLCLASPLVQPVESGTLAVHSDKKCKAFQDMLGFSRVLAF